MKYLIDTNIISELRKGERCDARVAQWWAGVGDEDLFLSVLVLGEIRKGIERARAKDQRQAEALEEWLRRVRVAFGDRILPVDESTAEEWGRMSAHRSRPIIDSLLAATAKTRGLILATRNQSDVAGSGAQVINPFESGDV